MRASESENADLLWGLRGGGGNFGLATAFEFDLHPVSTVLGGLVLHPASRATAVLQFFREFVAMAPDELTCIAIFLTAPPAPFVPPELHMQPAIAIAACYAGRTEEGEQFVKPLRTFGPPIADLFAPMPYPVLQSMFDESAPYGMQNYWKIGVSRRSWRWGGRCPGWRRCGDALTHVRAAHPPSARRGRSC
jgi:hypothetical protein